MADIAHAAENDDDLFGDLDAQHWAERFASKFEVLHKNGNGGVETDVEGLMRTWFAGCIESTRDAVRNG
jgi:hypothetical protein